MHTAALLYSGGGAHEFDDRDTPGGLGLVVGELRLHGGLLGVVLVSLGAGEHPSDHLDGFGADLDRRPRVGDQVVVLRRISSAPPLLAKTKIRSSSLK